MHAVSSIILPPKLAHLRNRVASHHTVSTPEPCRLTRCRCPPPLPSPAEWPWTLDACRSCSLAAQYLFAFYHCFLMLLGDRPDATQNAERVLALAMLYTGAFLYAVVVGA